MDFRDTQLYATTVEGGLVAGLVRWERGTITWVNPGGHQRAYVIAQLVSDDANRFAFVDEQGRPHELVALTPAFYNERVRRPEDPHPETDAELLAAFELSLTMGLKATRG